jgi:hypothetical protein
MTDGFVVLPLTPEQRKNLNASWGAWKSDNLTNARRDYLRSVRGLLNFAFEDQKEGKDGG